MMDKKEISQIIELVFALAAKTVSRLKAEKKATGDYSKTVTFEEKGYEIQFEALQYRGGYPPISVNLTFSVTVSRGGNQLMLFHVKPIKSRYDYFLSRDNRDDKFKIWAVVCDKSKVKPLFRSGDTICIANNQKAAFAKAEILSEEIEDTRFADTVTRKLRLTKELGHPETLAYETGYPAEVATYVADESTEEYFGGKKTLEKDIEVYCKLEPVEQDGLVWYEYIREVVSSNSSIDLTTPLTEAEVTMRLKEKALERLLEDCRGEFCYGDPRVQNYKKHYLILGEALIDRIHDVYLAWLKENCTTFAQDAQSGEFTGIAIDWMGKEEQQPNFSDYLLSGELPPFPEIVNVATNFENTVNGILNSYNKIQFITLFDGHGTRLISEYGLYDKNEQTLKKCTKTVDGVERNAIEFYYKDDDFLPCEGYAIEFEDHYDIVFDEENSDIIRIDKRLGIAIPIRVENAKDEKLSKTMVWSSNKFRR